ncbi:unnamed protein product [Amoebophrya sp. A25]|nr:unnamed protein product [Amoebophrya sp. A25]|eukprot:GSA25T00016393001.1
MTEQHNRRSVLVVARVRVVSRKKPPVYPGCTGSSTYRSYPLFRSRTAVSCCSRPLLDSRIFN